MQTQTQVESKKLTSIVARTRGQMETLNGLTGGFACGPIAAASAQHIANDELLLSLINQLKQSKHGDENAVI